MQSALADKAISVCELKKKPCAVLNETAVVALLNHNRVMGCMVPAAVYEAMVERLEDLKLAQLARARLEANETPVRVSLDELIDEAQAKIADGR